MFSQQNEKVEFEHPVEAKGKFPTLSLTVTNKPLESFLLPGWIMLFLAAVILKKTMLHFCWLDT